MKKILVTCVILACLTACEDKPIKTEISNNAWLDLTPQSYPDLYKKWGDNGFAKVNKFGPLAVKKLASMGKCHKIEYVSVSTNQSDSPDNAMYFADCSDGKRFYLSISDIESNRNIRSNDEILKNLDKEKYFNLCKGLIIANAMNPHTVDTSILNREINVSPTREIIVKIPFTAKNKLNDEGNFKAECTFKDEYSDPIITISQDK